MADSNHFPWRLFRRIVSIQALLILVTLAISSAAMRSLFKRQFLVQVETQLRVTLEGISRDLPATIPEQWCSNHSSSPSVHLTVIRTDGTVLCDSHHEPGSMENHFNRPEFQSAVQSGFGQSIQFSSELNEEMLYGALFIADRKIVLRGAIPLSNLNTTLRVFDASITLLIIILGLALTGFAVWFGRRLAFPIGRLLHKAQETAGVDYARNSTAGPYSELVQLESSLDQIRRDLETKAENLSREREEQATLMSAISDAILAVDLDGVALFYNSRFAVLFDKHTLKGSQIRLWELFRDPEVLESFKKTLRENIPTSVNAVRIDQDTGQKYLSLSISPLRKPENGQIYGAVGIFHDVTELKRAEQIRIDFVANVSHELRTPLTAIKGYTETLIQDVDQGRPVSREMAEVISRNSDRLMSLINDLLNLSWLESNADVMHFAPTPTEELTRKAFSQLQITLQSRNQKVDLRFDTPTVWGDPAQIEQVIINLVDNASKYTGIGSAISLAWERAPQTKGAILRVADNGPGIPLEHHARLFERFYRVDKARSREVGGTGLGLAIVKHIVQRHGGTVQVESGPGKGTTFHCLFPDYEGKS